MRGLASKVVVVTGGGGGIGGATCRRFADAGARVAVFDVNEETAAKVADQISADGGTAKAFACDITDYAAVQRAVAAAEAALGPIDVLVNNAGWDVFKPFTKTEPAEWDKLIAINLTGPLNMHHNITVNVVCPGPTNTNLFAGYKQGAADPDKVEEAFRRAVPLGRIGEPDDLPGAILFFASDDAAFITGQVLSVSGGLTMAG